MRLKVTKSPFLDKELLRLLCLYEKKPDWFDVARIYFQRNLVKDFEHFVQCIVEPTTA